MTDWILYFSIFWAISFIFMGLYLRYKYKDKFDELDQ
mgnify:FL=1